MYVRIHVTFAPGTKISIFGITGKGKICLRKNQKIIWAVKIVCTMLFAGIKTI